MGLPMISDTPGQGGKGVTEGKIFADVLNGWPLNVFPNFLNRYVLNNFNPVCFVACRGSIKAI